MVLKGTTSATAPSSSSACKLGALLGDDWWPYGIQRNRSAIDVVLRYHHEQGLTKRRHRGRVLPRFSRHMSKAARGT
jgi:hypothetical protein